MCVCVALSHLLGDAGKFNDGINLHAHATRPYLFLLLLQRLFRRHCHLLAPARTPTHIDTREQHERQQMAQCLARQAKAK